MEAIPQSNTFLAGLFYHLKPLAPQERNAKGINHFLCVCPPSCNFMSNLTWRPFVLIPFTTLFQVESSGVVVWLWYRSKRLRIPVALLGSYSNEYSRQPSRLEYTDCRDVSPPSNDYAGYDVKLSDGDVTTLEIWKMLSTPSLPLLQGLLCNGVVAPDWALSMSQEFKI